MRCIFIFFIFISLKIQAQDTVYARKVIKKLCSKECFGRGYVKNGLEVAAGFISSELKNHHAKPLFNDGYFQPFTFNVNTFPGKISLQIDGKILVPGRDFIVSPESESIKGKFRMHKKDSVAYIAEGPAPFVIGIRKKLTFSVSTHSANYSGVEILKERVNGEINTAEVDIESKLINNFESKNICALIDGRDNNDTMIIFSAHYDHLGGMGKNTFFPGANDNASGVSVVLNLAKYYSKNPPKYKTLFVFFAGEEAGLLGSKYFVEKKTVDLKKIKFLINLDLLGTGDDGIMVVNGAVLTKQFDILNKINSEQKLVKEIRRRGKAQNSDHYWFTEAGVPAFFIYTLGGTASYHDVNDIAEKLPLTDYVDVFKLITLFVDSL